MRALGANVSQTGRSTQISEHVAVVEAHGNAHRAAPSASAVVRVDRERGFGVQEARERVTIERAQALSCT
jgi:hypothetical protein